MEFKGFNAIICLQYTVHCYYALDVSGQQTSSTEECTACQLLQLHEHPRADLCRGADCLHCR